MQETKSTHDGLTLSDFLKIIGNRKAFIFLIIFLVVITTVGVTYTMPKWYEATTKIRVEKPNSGYDLFGTNINMGFDPYFIKEQFEIIQSKLILMKVIRDKDLQLVNYLSDKRQSPLTEELTYIYLKEQMLDIESLQGTSIINISVSVQEDAQMAADISNAIAHYYAEDRRKFAIQDQEEAFKNLQEARKDKETEVNKLRDELEKLRIELGITNDSQNYIPLDTELLRQMQQNKVTFETNLANAKTRYDAFVNIDRENRLNVINSETFPDVKIRDLHIQYMLKKQDLIAMEEEGLGTENPEYKAEASKFAEIKTQLDGLVDGFIQGLELDYKRWQSMLATVNKQITEAEQVHVKTRARDNRIFDDAKRKLEFEQDVLRTITVRLETDEIRKVVPKRTIEILNEAEPPMLHDKPSMTLNVIFAIVAGIILGIGAAFLIEYFDTSFRTVDDMERVLQLPILGVVTKKEVHVDGKNFNSFETEPYRVIQTNLELATRGQNAKVFAVQSAGPGEGKSTTLFNIGGIMAMVGQRVLIIDSDVRRPSQHKLSKAKPKPGLVDYLSGNDNLDEVIQKTHVDGLDIMTSGVSHGTHFSLSLLHSQKLHELVDLVAQKYDKVLLDSPPVIGISDSSVLANIADGIVFVVQHKRNPQSMSIRAKQILQNVEANIIGVVLNQVPTGGSEDYNYYTSNYSYYHSGSKTTANNGQSKEPALVNDIEAFDISEPESEEEKMPRV